MSKITTIRINVNADARERARVAIWSVAPDASLEAKEKAIEDLTQHLLQEQSDVIVAAAYALIQNEDSK